MGVERIRAIQDFDAARARAFRRSLRTILTGRAQRLRSIEPVLRAAGLEGRAFGGVQEIPVDRIVGSVAPDAKAADFDPLTFRDRYEEALLAHLKAKQAGAVHERKPTFAAPRRVINLMEALRRSVAEDKKPAAPRRGAAAAPARKRA